MDSSKRRQERIERESSLLPKKRAIKISRNSAEVRGIEPSATHPRPAGFGLDLCS
jgi:hypothetical protein